MKIELDQQLLPEKYHYSQERLETLEKMINEKVNALEGFISCAFVSEEDIKNLNKQYRNKDYIADVLAFSYLETERHGGEEDLLGEVVISFDQAKRQAEEDGGDIQRELDLLLIHGNLHVLGYDHEKEEDAQVMFPLQDNILKIFYEA